jgi:creatinine amidohydrolase
MAGFRMEESFAAGYKEHQRMSAEFETRYEWLRPAQLVARRDACPLIFVPVGPLEYHGPHLPLGTDAINCTRVAHACCRRLRQGVVLPTLTMGTERERCPAQVESFGFEPGTHIMGMDFPGRLWNSHYMPEEVFAIHLTAELRILIGQGYRYICIANGHGAVNHMKVIDRICVELSNTSPAKLVWRLTFPKEALNGGTGHADAVETSLMMHYNRNSVDLDVLPCRDVPIHTWEFSIVDSPGFTPRYYRDHVVRNDPRDGNPNRGQELFEWSVNDLAADAEKLIISHAYEKTALSNCTRLHKLEV